MAYTCVISPQFCCVNKALFPWCFPSTLDLTLFSTSSPQGSLSPERGSLMETSMLDSQGLSLTCCLWFLCLFLFTQGDLLWLWLNRTLIYEYIIMLLGVIYCYISFSRAIVLGFSLVALTSSISLLATWVVWAMGSTLWSGHQTQSELG